MTAIAILAVAPLLTACSSLDGLDLRDVVNLADLARIAATPVASVRDITPTAPPPDLSTAALVKQRAMIRVGIRYDAPPLARVNSEGELEGMDVDLAREFARRWLGGERNVEFVQVTSSSAPRMIKNREIDLAMGGLVHTRSAEADADFSLTYLYDGEALLVRAGTFADFAGLRGRTVTYIDFPSAVALGEAQIATNITVSLQVRNSYRAAVNDLLEGTTDAVAGRWRRLRATAAGDSALAVATVLTVEPVGIMLPEHDSEWADLVNLTLSAIIADGTFARIYQRWFGAPPDPIPILAPPTRLQLVELADRRTPRDALTALRAAGVIRVGFDPQATPFAALQANGQPAGYEVDLVREIARRWFGALGRIQFTALPADRLAAELAAGTLDLAIGGIQHTAPNELKMDFSSTTFVSAGVALGIALPMNDSALRDLVNFTLQDMQADGTFARIFQRWFPNQAVPEIERWPGSSPSVESLLAEPAR